MAYVAAYRSGNQSTKENMNHYVNDDDHDDQGDQHGLYDELEPGPLMADGEDEDEDCDDDRLERGGRGFPPRGVTTDSHNGAGLHRSGRLYSFGDRAVGIAGRMLDGGKQLFLQQRQRALSGEGPSLLRFLCFLGGLGMLVSSVLSMVNIFSFLTSPSTYVLQTYQGFFGIITMVVEAKDWECIDQLKPWMVEWFRFLTVPAGKGAFYIFVGSLGVSLWVRNLLAFTVGVYMSLMGFTCIAVHTGSRNKTTAGGRREMDAYDYEIQRRGHAAMRSLMDPAYDDLGEGCAVHGGCRQNFFRNDGDGDDDGAAGMRGDDVHDKGLSEPSHAMRPPPQRRMNDRVRPTNKQPC